MFITLPETMLRNAYYYSSKNILKTKTTNLLKKKNLDHPKNCQLRYNIL